MSKETFLFPAWKQAVKDLLDEGLTYGSVISRKRIAEMCQVQPPTSIEDVRRYDLELLQCIGEIKDVLLTSHCMLMATDHKGSFVIIAPESQTEYAVNSGVKAIGREMRRMAMSVSFTKTSLLSAPERAKNADAQAKISMLAGMLKLQNQDLQRLTEKKNETHQ